MAPTAMLVLIVVLPVCLAAFMPYTKRQVGNQDSAVTEYTEMETREESGGSDYVKIEVQEEEMSYELDYSGLDLDIWGIDEVEVAIYGSETMNENGKGRDRGHDTGHGKGGGNDHGKGHGEGHGEGGGKGSVDGYGKGDDNTYGNGKDNGKVHRKGKGKGHSQGNGKGHWQGKGKGPWQGNGKGIWQGKGKGHLKGKGKGHGHGKGKGHDNGMSSDRNHNAEGVIRQYFIRDDFLFDNQSSFEPLIRESPSLLANLKHNLISIGEMMTKHTTSAEDLPWDDVDILGIVKIMFSNRSLTNIKQFLDGTVWNAIGITDDLFSDDAAADHGGSLDPFSGVVSPLCAAFRNTSMLYPTTDHDPSYAFWNMPPEIQMELSRVRRTIRNMNGSQKACARSFTAFMKKTLPTEQTLSELISRYGTYLTESGDPESVKHVRWSMKQARDPDSIIHDIFYVNRHIIQYISEWQGHHHHPVNSGLCPRLNHNLHRMIHEIHNLPPAERGAAMTLRYFLKMNPEAATVANYSSVAEEVGRYLGQGEFTSQDEDTSTSGLDVESTMAWIWSQNATNETLGQRMWTLSVQLRRFLEMKMERSNKWEMWKFPKNLTDDRRKIKYEIKRLTDENDRNAAWEYKHFLWRYNGTADDMESLGSEFEGYLIRRSNKSFTVEWFLSGIHNNESFAYRMTQLAIDIQAHKETMKTSNTEWSQVMQSLPDDLSDTMVSLRNEMFSLSSEEQEAVNDYKSFIQQYDGSLEIGSISSALSTYMNTDLMTSDIMGWFNDQLLEEDSLGSRLFNVTMRIKTIHTDMMNGTDKFGGTNTTEWQSKWSIWRNNTHVQDNMYRNMSDSSRNYNGGRDNSHGSHSTGNHGMGSGHHGMGSGNYGKSFGYHKWPRKPWFFRYLSLDLQEEVDELMDEKCNLSPANKKYLNIIKDFFRDFKDHMGDGVVIDLDTYLNNNYGGLVDMSDLVEWFRAQIQDTDSFPARMVTLHNAILEHLEGQHITLDDWNSQDPRGFHDHFKFHGHGASGFHGHDDGPMHNGPMRMLLDQLPEALRETIHSLMHAVPHLDTNTRHMVTILKNFMLEKRGGPYRTLSVMLPSVTDYLDEQYGMDNNLSIQVTTWFMEQQRDPDSIGNQMLDNYNRILEYILSNYYPGMDETFQLIAEMSSLDRRLMGLDHHKRLLTNVLKSFLMEYLRDKTARDHVTSLESIRDAFTYHVEQEYDSSDMANQILTWFNEQTILEHSIGQQMLTIGQDMAQHIETICGQPGDVAPMAANIQASVYRSLTSMQRAISCSMDDLTKSSYRVSDIPTLVVNRLMSAAKTSLAGIMDLTNRSAGRASDVNMCMCI